MKFENVPIENAVWVLDLSNWKARLDFGGVSMEVHPSDEKWTVVNSVKVQAEKHVLMYPRIEVSMDSIPRYEAFGIASGAYSSMKNIVLIARLEVRRGSHC